MMYDLILQTSNISNGEMLFSDGNVETGVQLFEKQHVCNKFCLWPAFGLQVFGDSEVDTDKG